MSIDSLAEGGQWPANQVFRWTVGGAYSHVRLPACEIEQLVGHRDIQNNAWVFVPELREQRCQHAHQQRVGCGGPDLATGLQVTAGHLAFGGQGGLVHDLCRVCEFFPCQCGSISCTAPLKENHPKALFNIAQPPEHRSMAHAQRPRRSRQRARCGNSEHQFKVIPRQIAPCSRGCSGRFVGLFSCSFLQSLFSILGNSLQFRTSLACT